MEAHFLQWNGVKAIQVGEFLVSQGCILINSFAIATVTTIGKEMLFWDKALEKKFPFNTTIEREAGSTGGIRVGL